MTQLPDQATDASTEPLRVSPLMRAAFLLALVASLAVGAWAMAAAVGTEPKRPDITDYHAIDLAGRLAGSGHLTDAYRASVMLRLETELGHGRIVFMPWSYPPTYDILAAGLASLGLVPGFLVLGTASAALFLIGVWSIDRRHVWPVLLAAFVPVLLNLRCGQNGLLTGGLVAASCAAALRGKVPRAGLALALATIKPHLVLTVPLVLAWRRRWAVLAWAAAGVVAMTLASLLAFGPGVFVAWFRSMPDVGRMMAAGAYPLHRMTSIYACALSFGASPALALALHGTAAVAVLLGAGRVVLRCRDLRVELGVAVLAGLFVSPYVYDYDGTLFAVGFLLLSPALLERLPRRTYAMMLALYGLTMPAGFLVNALTYGAPENAPALMGPPLLALVVAVLRVLGRRAPSAAATDVAAAAAPAPAAA